MSTEIVNHSIRTHHPYGPSKLNYLDPRVGGCLGFFQEDSTSEAAEDGTALHEIVERVLRDYLANGKGSLTSFAFASRIKYKWDDDSDNLLVYVWAFLEPRLKPGCQVFLEIKATLLRDDGSEINYGSLDLFITYKDGTSLLVDWKFGYVPVLPAETNRQGWNYLAACGQMFPDVKSIEVAFVMPRIQWTSTFVFGRERFAELTTQVGQLVAQADDPSWDTVGWEQPLNPGAACKYCSKHITCSAYLGQFKQGVVALGGLSLPTHINIDAIDTPERAALAKTWVDFLELAIKPIKARALELAKANSGEIRAELPDGSEVKYKVFEKALSRGVGDAVKVAELLKDWVGPDQVLGAASLALGDLTKIVVASRQNSEDGLSKKQATKDLISLLELNGLLTREDGETEYLKKA